MTVRILAVETATHACSAALAVDGTIIERYALAPRQHAALILPMIESVLAEAGCGVAQLDAIAFGRGPGAFTGVRIAASIVQGIAFAADRPVIPVSTLAALALGGMRESGMDCAMAALDARKDEVYWACYRRVADNVLQPVGTELVGLPSQVTGPEQGDWLGIGSGWESYPEALMRRFGERVLRVMPDLEPRAADVLRLSLADFAAGQVCDAAAAIPVYLRNNVAEVRQSRPG